MIDAPRSARNGPEKANPEVAARLSRIVRDLVWELHPHMQRRVAVTLDSDLDRDLGLDSLGRACRFVESRMGSLSRPSPLDMLRWPGIAIESTLDLDVIGQESLTLLDSACAELRAAFWALTSAMG